jgi:hypothetical protein
VVHHVDYLNARDDHTLCGVAIGAASSSTHVDAADALCPDCEAQLVVYHLEWWRTKALAVTAELDELRAKYPDLFRPADAETPEAPAVEAKPDHVVVVTTDSASTDAFLDRARLELTDLCRQFEGAVPFYRLKNTMQDFSDRLDDTERLLLAQEVGADSSLIRWATTQVEILGFTVTNNRVQENSDMMWQEWLEESQQAPPKTKRRFGRSR